MPELKINVTGRQTDRQTDQRVCTLPTYLPIPTNLPYLPTYTYLPTYLYAWAFLPIGTFNNGNVCIWLVQIKNRTWDINRGTHGSVQYGPFRILLLTENYECQIII